MLTRVNGRVMEESVVDATYGEHRVAYCRLNEISTVRYFNCCST
jgi:hypothetical protein